MTAKSNVVALTTASVVKALFTFERETPGAVRYMEVDEAGAKKDKGYAIGTLYFRKDQFPTPFPKNITVTVEVN